MNWKLLQKILPLAFKVAQEIHEGLVKNESNDEIRKRLASPGVILDDELSDLRAHQRDLDDYVKTGR